MTEEVLFVANNKKESNEIYLNPGGTIRKEFWQKKGSVTRNKEKTHEDGLCY